MQFGKSPRFETALPDSMHTAPSAGADNLPADCVLTEMAREMFGTYPSATPAGGASGPPLAAVSSPVSAYELADVASRPLGFSGAEAGSASTGVLPATPVGGLPATPVAAPALSPTALPGVDSPFYFVREAPAVSRFALASPVDLKEMSPHISATTLGLRPFNVNAVRKDFPILDERVSGKPLIWLDNAATTHKPQAVIDRIAYYYEHENSNIHRAAHELAARSTDAYEAARGKVARFLNAPSKDQIVFTRGATEAINLVAQTWGRQYIGKDDEIVITWLEHHANIVPWQQLAAEKGAILRVAPVDDTGQVLVDEYAKLLNSRTKLVAFPQVSNALGTVTPARAMVDIAHRNGALVLVDGAQAVSHMRQDVVALDADWYVFSGHKVFAPTGIGAIYGKSEVLESMQPWQGGGNMIKDVSFEKTAYQDPPMRFEAGTGSIADAVGLGAAVDYVQHLGLDNISRYEHDLLVYATNAMERVAGLKMIGTAPDKAAVLSFVIDGIPTDEIGSALSREGIAVRAGHHCAQPILRRFGLESTVRPSLAFYNTREEIDALVVALKRIRGGSRSINQRGRQQSGL
jgi:cysteine desulfurase/selenocysteine lyase